MNQILFLVFFLFLIIYSIYSYLLLAYLKRTEYLKPVNTLLSTIYIIISLVIINISLLAFFIGGGLGNSV